MDGVQLPKDERLSQPWSHSVVLNTGLLDLESSRLTTRPSEEAKCKLFCIVSKKFSLLVTKKYVAEKL